MLNGRRHTRPGQRLDTGGPMRQSARVAHGGEDWATLARHVRNRRERVGLHSQQALADAASVSLRTIGSLERGESVGRRTLVRIEQALRWRPGSAADVLAGRPVDPSADAPPFAPTVDSARQQVLEATHEQLVQIATLIQALQGAAAAEEFLRKALQMRADHRAPTVAEGDRSA